MTRSSSTQRKLFSMLGLLLGAGLILSSCATVATEQDIMALNDQVVLLNKRLDAVQDSVGKQQASLSKELSGDVDTRLNSIRGSLAEMVAETDRIKGDLSDLSGKVEENTHLAKHAIERDTSQEDLMRAGIADLKTRVEGLEKSVEHLKTYLGLQGDLAQKGPKTEEGKTAPAPAEVSPEKIKYENSLSDYKAGRTEEAIVGFKDFIKMYPRSDLADNAQFWIGECYMALNQYEQAILAFQQVIKHYPKGNKVPNAMLRQALAFEAIRDTTSAKLLLKKIIKDYPNSNEAGIAKTKLQNMK